MRVWEVNENMITVREGEQKESDWLTPPAWDKDDNIEEKDCSFIRY